MKKVTEMQHQNRCEELLDHIYDGKLLKDITVDMDLSLATLKRIKNSDEYKELDYQRQTEIRCIREARRQKVLDRLDEMQEKVFSKLEELCQSESEKIALDASKFLATHMDKLSSDANEQSLQTINVGFDLLAKEKIYPQFP